jgi:hypothetical protein
MGHLRGAQVGNAGVMETVERSADEAAGTDQRVKGSH